MSIESFDCPVAPGEWAEPETALDAAKRELIEGMAKIEAATLREIHEGAKRIASEWRKKAEKIGGKL